MTPLYELFDPVLMSQLYEYQTWANVRASPVPANVRVRDV